MYASSSITAITVESGDYSSTPVLSDNADDHKPRSIPQPVNKHEEIENSDVIFASNLELDLTCGDVKAEEELDESLSARLDANVFVNDKGKGVANVDEIENSGYGSDGNDPVKRLQELIRLSNVEEELSEEVLSINNQLQEDELLAMESIYGCNMSILGNQNGLRCFQVYIHVEAPNGIAVTTNFNASNSSVEKTDNSTDFSYSFRVEYLQPVILTCVLPKAYPSNCGPIFNISVPWLDSANISNLCHKLDSICQEQAGQEVIYQCVEWLQDCSLSHLGFESEVVLAAYGLNDGQDRRAISGCTSPNIVIPSMKNYNEEQRHKNFCKHIQECCICFSEYAGTEFIRLPCQHFFCLKCMKTFIDKHVEEGTVLKIHCPEPKCEGMIPPTSLKRLLGVKEFERWESLMVQKTLESMSDVHYCPRCETACLEDDNSHAQCSKCYYNFCTLCRGKRHVGENCTTPERLQLILKERPRGNSSKAEQRRREADMINQILSIKEIACFTKPCPSCRIAIARTEGCNKMVCGNCGQFFCYCCNQAIDGDDHFSEGQCKTFPVDPIERWEETQGKINFPEIADQIGAEILGSRCPNCRERNPKVGDNNHIFCRWCQTYSCFLCKKIVTRKQAAKHYDGLGTCMQYT